ncbi:hypothetical protein Bhyg_00638 [Pseudolycoriella hygida]|uniref:Uncharacterized protein n=1 Tax=Pseudolycoriella hygida TaxID=35572 RepID=A0A9Q0N8T2_9DIPT|nr:hypothetical protein Bhyg_00638 [Pseudolycoriella hygida]
MTQYPLILVIDRRNLTILLHVEKPQSSNLSTYKIYFPIWRSHLKVVRDGIFWSTKVKMEVIHNSEG